VGLAEALRGLAAAAVRVKTGELQFVGIEERRDKLKFADIRCREW
jgi:hypothetical protein